MVVQHNLTAMNANRMLGITTNAQAKATEKLSSGYKINRAADDAAGLSISEKMRKQIRGLTRASENAEDGISCVQTAEGALTEVHSMLQRMNELAVQASNGTLTEEDRQSIQDEIDQLCDEIDRVSETTEFNELSLLKGDSSKGTDTKSVLVSSLTASYATGVSQSYAVDYANASVETSSYGYYVAGTDQALSGSQIIDMLEIDSDGKLKYKDGKAPLYTNASSSSNLGQQMSVVKASELSNLFVAKTKAPMDASSKVVEEADLSNYFNEDGGYKGGLYGYDTNNSFCQIGAEKLADYVDVSAASYSEMEVDKALTIEFQVGAVGNTANKISVDLEAMSTESLGLKGLSVTGTDSTNADNAIDRVTEAIKQVSQQRSKLGAVQNRLEHTIANLDNVVENTTSAESAIRDTDMAEAMVEYSKNSILAQAGQSMLAQANSATQGVLSLLQ